MKKTLLYKISLCLLVLCVTSCKKLLQVEGPKNQVSEELVFSSDETATATVIGLYSKMMTSNLVMSNGGLSLHPALSADELYNTAANTDIDAFTKNALSATNTLVNTRFWSHAYALIYHCNRIIGGLSAADKLSLAVKNQLLGESYLVRSFYYYYLLNLFGAVPLITSSDFDTNANLPRTDEAIIYQQITTDLLKAQALLPAAYPAPTRVRPNKAAATAFLARVYLQREDWVNAELQASSLLNNSNYALETNLNNVFLSNSKEVIWQLQPTSTTISTGEGNTFIPISVTTRPAYALTPSLLNAFEAGDARKLNWTKSNTVSGQTYYYPFKYKIRTGTGTPTENNILFRLAEQYLIRAEARAHQNNITGSKSDLNLIRTRAGLGLSIAINQGEVIAAILQERRIELLAELGHRWIDLKRTGNATQILSFLKTDWQNTDMLYPIPQTEIDRNPNLIQNPGY